MTEAKKEQERGTKNTIKEKQGTRKESNEETGLEHKRNKNREQKN